MSKYFLTDGKDKFGPFSKKELSNQNISRETKVWCYGMEKWTELSQVSDLRDLISSIPPELNLKKETSSIPPLIQKKKVSSIGLKENNRKWLIAILAISLISVFAYSLIQNQSDVNQYNVIVANSYESDEDFDMYVKKFYRDLNFYGVFPKIPKEQIIKFSKLDQLDNTTHIHGLSFGIDDDDRIEIYINPSSWRKFNKPMRYYLMYHELTHDVLNLDDLDEQSSNEGKLMYPAISSYEKKNMDNFIESVKNVFEEQQTE